MSFVQILKDNKIIKDYFWGILYNNKEFKEQEEGVLYLGESPHLIKDKIGFYEPGSFKENNMISMPLKEFPFTIGNEISVAKLLIYDPKTGNNTVENSKDMTLLKLDFEKGGIVVPFTLLHLYQAVFMKYRGNCYNSSFLIQHSYTFYYCKKNKNIISNIKNELPRFSFVTNEMNFTIPVDDLFYEEQEYIYCLLLFEDSIVGKNFILGRPFLKNYQFFLNYDKKYLFYYKKTEDSKSEEPEPESNNMVVIIVSVVLTIIIVSIAFILFFKFYLYEKFFRKKRVCELQDDNDYDYKEEKTDKEEKEDKLNIN
jgi:hypothetical protein